MPSLQDILSLSLHRNSENIAFSFSGKSFTYLELRNRIAHFQKVLFRNSQPIESIGIIANQDFDTYSVILAALLSGITYVPIEPLHPDDRNNRIIRISKIKAIYCSDFATLRPDFYKTNKLLFQKIKPETNDSEKLEVTETENPVYILFTSGSTGVPKGVPISMKNLDAFTKNVNNMKLGINEKSRFLQVFELTFDLSVFSYLIPLLNGASVFTAPKTSFIQMAAIQLIEEQKITHVLTVPSFINHLKPLFPKIKLPSVTNWLLCGEALKSDLVASWQKCLPEANIYNVYGPTEATIFCSSYLCNTTN
jgi:D-alanine--poly(phosphoribitol) ligase subunit 1